jgi:hypothetical protein
MVKEVESFGENAKAIAEGKLLHKNIEHSPARSSALGRPPFVGGGALSEGPRAAFPLEHQKRALYQLKSEKAKGQMKTNSLALGREKHLSSNRTKSFG